MSSEEELLGYYQQELTYIRRLGAEFAEKHPKIAGRLGLSEKMIEDPHVARLIEAFAFANARISHKLDDEFPEISDALLNILHPHLLAPIPAMSIVQFQPNRDKLLDKKNITAGTVLASDEGYGEICKFTTRYPVELWPIEVVQANLQVKPLQAPNINGLNNAAAVLRISLRCLQDKMQFDQLNMDSLRFFINLQAQDAYAIYELLFNNTIAIVLADSLSDKNPIILEKSALQPVGFAEQEGMLPYSKRTFMGYRLLLEFFAFPEKFLFFDLVNLKNKIQNKNITAGNSLEILFYLSEANTALEKNINAKAFALGCTPIVNLFEKMAEPFELTHTQAEYHLIADAHRIPEASEIYTIKRVIATTEAGAEIEYQPFYGLKHYQNCNYYHANRKPAWQGTQYQTNGTEIFLSFTDLNFNPVQAEKTIIHTEIWCTNRDLPSQLPFGGNEPRLYLLEQNMDSFRQIKCLLPLTQTRRPALKQGARWRCISHLSLNYLSLTNDEQGIAALRSILKLYNFADNDEQLGWLTGLLSVQHKPVFARNPDNCRGNAFWQGTKIILNIDESKLSGTGIYLLGCILERFFALYTTINSFTELEIVSLQQNKAYRWPPRAGNKVLL